jgi:crotonobetainyl-CoA:carnitine CoA-transferase CaiB-like acyl-CoA transferase
VAAEHEPVVADAAVGDLAAAVVGDVALASAIRRRSGTPRVFGAALTTAVARRSGVQNRALSPRSVTLSGSRRKIGG